MVMCKKGCLCFRSLKTASVAAGMFTLVVSLMQILVFIAAAVGILSSYTYLKPLIDAPVPGDKWERTFFISYLVLAIADLLVVIFSLIMLCGIEPKRPRRCYFYLWIIFFPFYIIYESALNICFFYRTFTDKVVIPGSNHPYLIIPIIYWPIKEVIILIFWFIVIFYTLEVSKAQKAGKVYEAEAPATPAGIPPHVDNHYVTPRVPFYQTPAGCTRPCTDPMTNYGYISRCNVAPALPGRPSYSGGGAMCRASTSGYCY